MKWALLIALIVPAAVLSGCLKFPPDEPGKPGKPLAAIKLLTITDTLHPLADGAVNLEAARNEWVSFAVQLDLPPGWEKDQDQYALRISPLMNQAAAMQLEPQDTRAYQVLPVPVDVNRAGYVRHTGQSAAHKMLPRALLPLAGQNGLWPLAGLRGTEGAAPVVWIDLHVPARAAGGATYAGAVEIVRGKGNKVVATTPLSLSLWDFVLPDERHLTMVAQVPWDSLRRLWRDRFEAITPRLLSRRDERYAACIRTLDDLVTLAQAHRVQVTVPLLQPTVKWQAGKTPLIDWSDFDSVVGPWLSGAVFADRTPLGFWALPATDYLDRYDRQSQLEYWTAAARHFDQLDWIARAPAMAGVRSNMTDAAICTEATELIGAHPKLRVMLGLEEDRVALGAGAVDASQASRLIAAAPGLVFAPPVRAWPADAARPARWLRTDVPGLVPYIGAGGDEHDVRVWAFLAYLRQAQLILWANPLPTTNSATQPADPDELTWFYPGSWFGVEQPVPTVQLKWLLRAEQDYEYLWLARQRQEALGAMVMARLITKPVEIQPAQEADPAYALMSGTADPAVWPDARRLLARTILLKAPGQPVDEAVQRDLNIQMLQWIEPQERPILMGRTSQWYWDTLRKPGGNWVDLRLGIDIYNASDSTPGPNSLQWSALPQGWQVRPEPLTIQSLATYQVKRFALEGKLDLSQVSPSTRLPVTVTYTDGFTRRSIPVQLVLPVANCDRREGKLTIDGSLEDWDAADALQDGPLVRMFSRPALQKQSTEAAATPTQIYSGWSEEDLYVAFKVEGVATRDVRSTRNFVDYQFRRAWGEDLCEVLIQPVYGDNSTGPVLHVVCKPSGHWVEQNTSAKLDPAAWQTLSSVGIRFASTVDNGTWRGEVAIPWSAINAAGKKLPGLLRFNFAQHQTATGDSASWAGPVDFGRDASFMGLLYVRQPNIPGMGPPPGE